MVGLSWLGAYWGGWTHWELVGDGRSELAGYWLETVQIDSRRAGCDGKRSFKVPLDDPS